ncbi:MULTISPECIES: siderophore ABC transporter substrate-binding protein [Roseobacteraceae]|uniref:Putative ABC transporter solute-binding protein YclQ n=1 Tax=Pseudosulfitobacter pseudonitzschiae TaxID=1402135 RepID=A0A221K863_9RHOB|nr:MULTISPECIES: siderophore ABC transporter substrate-binding protein [Roseobacteraceae]ASM75194.1 putative ABC transporter solute-binding protein YclQ [Pseudosulfitobacter pseudonitzschiae]
MLRAIGFLMFLLSVPANAETVAVETFAGRIVAPVLPDRIAVFDLAALDSLTALGVQPFGLISRVYLPYLEDAAVGTVPVGSLFEPDFEAVFAMSPDLIIAGGRSSEQVPELARIAPTLDMTIWGNTVEEGLARLAAYGQIFDKQAEAESLITDFNNKLSKVRAAVSGSGRALIVMTNGPKISAYGAGGRFGWLHDALELPEAVESVEKATHGEAISFEFIREANPDILFVIDRIAAIGQDSESASATLDNVLVHETTAWKTGQVIHLSAGPIYLAGGGIQSMTLTLDEILAGLKDR